MLKFKIGLLIVAAHVISHTRSFLDFLSTKLETTGDNLRETYLELTAVTVDPVVWKDIEETVHSIYKGEMNNQAGAFRLAPLPYYPVISRVDPDQGYIFEFREKAKKHIGNPVDYWKTYLRLVVQNMRESEKANAVSS